MMPEITQENFRVLLPAKISAVVGSIAQGRPCSLKDALLAFYASEVYQELEIEATKRWWQSPSRLFQDFNESAK